MCGQDLADDGALYMYISADDAAAKSKQGTVHACIISVLMDAQRTRAYLRLDWE